MYEFKLPRLGYVKLSSGDFLYLSVAMFFVIWGTLNIIYADRTLDIVLASLQILSGLSITYVSLSHGKRRIMWEERVNPIKQQEAYQNHILAEGI